MDLQDHRMIISMACGIKNAIEVKPFWNNLAMSIFFVLYKHCRFEFDYLIAIERVNVDGAWFANSLIEPKKSY